MPNDLLSSINMLPQVEHTKISSASTEIGEEFRLYCRINNTDAYYNVGPNMVSVNGKTIEVNLLAIYGVIDGGFLRIERKISVEHFIASPPVALSFVAGGIGEEEINFDTVDLLRRRKGKLISHMAQIADAVDVPEILQGEEIPLDPDYLHSIASTLKGEMDSWSVHDELWLSFAIKIPKFALYFGLPTLVSANDILLSQNPPSEENTGAATANKTGLSPAEILHIRRITAQPPKLPPVGDSTISSKDMKAIDKEIGHIRRKLWGGYSAYGVRELENIFTSPLSFPEARARAGWELSRWKSVTGDFAEVVSLLGKARQHSKVFARRKTFRLLEINALLQLGWLPEALNQINIALDVKPNDNDYALAKSNYLYFAHKAELISQEEMDEQRLAIFNGIFKRAGLSEIRKASADLPLTLGNLCPSNHDMDVSAGPKVSVLMAAYGAEEHLHIAVECLLNQTWRNLELIIVEDRSPDRTWELMQAYAARDDRVKIYRNDQNMGAYMTRNRALSLATGDYVTVHDSDDWSHPEMIRLQVEKLMESEEVKATFSMMCRATDDLRFGIRPSRMNLEIVHRSYPSLMMRRDELLALGIWDGVRANADAEMVARARDLYGADNLVDVMGDTPLSFFLVRPESLTEQGETSLLSLTFGVRHEYDRQADYMRKKFLERGETFGARVSKKEPFASPQLLLPHHLRPVPDYDLLIVSDLSLLGGTRSCNLAYIDCALAAGKRVALFHYPRGDLRLLPDISEPYRDRNQLDSVDIITCEEEIRCKTVVLHHPPILTHALDKFPTVHAEHGVILVNQLPYQIEGKVNSFYEPLLAEKAFEKMFHVKPQWLSISGLVHRHLSHFQGDIALSDAIWLPPLASIPPYKPRTAIAAERPFVVGRHSRDHWTKWPEDRSILRQAYLVDTDVNAIFLGGADFPVKQLNDQPANWQILQFDEIPVDEFLGNIDFMIHFPHHQYIEEFGRNIGEAMAASVPVIIPPKFREVFEDAAIYCEAHEVHATAIDYWQNLDRYNEVSRNAWNFITHNCGPDAVKERLKGLIEKGI